MKNQIRKPKTSDKTEKQLLPVARAKQTLLKAKALACHTQTTTHPEQPKVPRLQLLAKSQIIFLKELQKAKVELAKVIDELTDMKISILKTQRTISSNLTLSNVTWKLKNLSLKHYLWNVRLKSSNSRRSWWPLSTISKMN